MILVDSNIIVYSLNKTSPKYLEAQEFLKKNRGQLAVAHQNILESLRVVTHPKYNNQVSLTVAIDAILSLVNGFEIISPVVTTHHIAIQMIKKYKFKSNKIFDAYLAATMLSNGIDVIATDNEIDFAKIKEIKVLNPFK